MKFKMKAGDLFAALERVGQTVDKKDTSGAPCILIDAQKKNGKEAIFFYSTNMTAEVVDKVTGTVEEAGKSLLNVDLLRQGLANRDPNDEVKFALVAAKGKSEPSRLNVKVGKGQFHLAYTANGADVLAGRMNSIPYGQKPACSISGTALSQFVRRAMFCVPQASEATQKYEFGGMRVLVKDGFYEAHATDGHVCAKIRIKGDGAVPMTPFIVPHPVLPPMAKLTRKEDVIKIIEGQKRLYFRMGDNTFFGCRLLEGKFPNVEGMFQLYTPDFWFNVDRETLHRALQRAAAFDKKRYIRLTFTNSSMTILAKSQVEDIEDEIAIENIDVPANASISHFINLDYLLNIAGTSTKKQLKVGISESIKKAIIVDDTDESVETVYAVMPSSGKAAD